MKKSEMIRLMQNAWTDYILNVDSPENMGTRQGMEKVLEAMEKFGKHGEEIQQALMDLDERLAHEYSSHSVLEVTLPKSQKAWVKLIEEHGHMSFAVAEDGKPILVIEDLNLF